MDTNKFRASIQARKEATTKEDQALKKMLELSERYISILNEEELMREEQTSRTRKELEEMKKALEAKGITLNFSVEPDERNELQEKAIQSEWLQYLAQLGLFGLNKIKLYQLSSGIVAFSEENNMEYMKFIRYKGLPYVEENLLKGYQENDSEEKRIQKAKKIKQITRTMGVFRGVDIGPNISEQRNTMSTYEWKKLVGTAAKILLKRQQQAYAIMESEDESAREQYEEKLRIEATNVVQEKSDAVFADVKAFLKKSENLNDIELDSQPEVVKKEMQRLIDAVNSVMSQKNNINETEMLRAFRIEGNINRLIGDYSMDMFSFEEALKVIEAYLSTVERYKDNEEALRRTSIGTFVTMAEEEKGGRKAYIAKHVVAQDDAAR